MSELPIAPIKRIIKTTGATRVSDEAAESLEKILTNFAREIAVEAKKVAEHAGRQTIKAEDIELVV
jgi:histone H3/H4